MIVQEKKNNMFILWGLAVVLGLVFWFHIVTLAMGAFIIGIIGIGMGSFFPFFLYIAEVLSLVTYFFITSPAFRTTFFAT